jgi:hypothetical protein
MKGTCIEDFENRISSGTFIFRKEEIKGGWRIVA